MMRALLFLVVPALAVGLTASGRAPAQAAAGAAGQHPIDFVRDIRPILESACIKCHGPEKPKGRLRLDARSFAMAGSISGPVIVPGKAAESLLYQVLIAPDADDRMPRKSAPLAREKIELLRAWIDQ